MIRVILLWLMCGALLAQGDKTSISGMVLDAAGGVVAGAEVKAVGERTGFTLASLTTDGGVFRLPGLPAGVYTLTVEAAGFKTYRAESLELIPGQEVTRTIRLELGQFRAEVTVEESVPEIERVASSGVRGSSFTPWEVESVPMVTSTVGRNYRALSYQTPGVGYSRTGHAPFTVNGNRPIGAINTMVDSAEYNDFVSGNVLGRGMTEQPVSMETVEAVQLQTSNFKAEYGRASGAVVNLVTKRGSNHWHGSSYYLLMNEKLNARNALLAERAPLRLNMPGITLGGPIAPNRLFVFFGYETIVRNAYRASSTIPTLTLEERARAAPAVRPLLKYYPEPNIPGTNLHSAAIASPTTTPTALLRMDYQISASHQLAGRVNFVKNIGGLRERLWGGDATSANRSQSGVLTLDSALTPRVFNQVRGTYTQFYSNVIPLYPSLGDPAINGQVGLLVVTGLQILGQFRWRNESTFHNYTVADDLTWARGSHIVKLGAIFRITQANNESDRNFNGTLVFPSVPAFLAAQPLTYSRAVGDSRLDLRNREYGVYWQDDWRIRPSVTLNLGVRYEYYGVAGDKFGRIVNLYSRDMNNLAPRLGFAWDLGGKTTTILRGGYGIFYSPLQMEFVGQARYAPPLVTTFSRFRPTMPELLAGAAIGSDAYLVDRAIRNPYVQNWNLTVERQLFQRGTVVSAAYVGNRGLGLPRTARPNGGENLAANLRPMPALGVVSYLTGGAASNYHAAQLSLRSVLGRRLSLRAAYTFSRSIDNASDTALLPIDERNWNLDRGLSDFQQRHLTTVLAAYDLPWRARNPWLGGWQLVALLVSRSGSPFNLFANTNNPTGTLNNRIHAIPGTIELRKQGSQWFQLAPGVTPAQLQPAPGVVGTLGRNVYTGPHFVDFTLGIHKNFTVTERWRMQLRGEFFNVINRANFDNPVDNLGNAAFGRILTAADPRQVQLMVKLIF